MEKKSEYQISSSVNDGILEIIITGELHYDIMHDVIDITKTNNVKKMLIDVSALKGHLSITETYSNVRNYPPHIYRIRFAMVNINGQDEFERFHETTACNAGMILKWFTNLDFARAWLKSE